MRFVILGITALLLAVAPAHAAEGDWFFVNSKNTPATSNVSHPAYKQLRNDAVGLAFTPNDDWVLLTGGNGLWSSNLALPACQKMSALQKDSTVRDFHCVSFGPTGGWVLLYDRTFAAAGVAGSLVRKLRDLSAAGTLPRSVVLPPGGGWLILAGATGVYHEGIPPALAKVLDGLRAKSVPITCVACTTAGDWFVLTRGAGLHTNRPDHPATRLVGPAGGWLAFSPGDSPGGYYLVSTPGRRVKATLKVTLAQPGADVSEWSVYAPKAPNFDGQRDVKTALTPDGRVVQELSALRRPMLASRVPGRASEVRLVLSLEATLVARRLLPRVPGVEVPKVADLSTADVKLYTRATSSMDLTARPFVDWLTRHELRRGKNESEVAFARRAYSFIKHHFEYEYRKVQDMHPSVVCREGKSDCGGLSTLLVATLRVGGVPARLLQGRWANSEQAGAKIGGITYKQWHIKSEFFARGVGWVPVDMASAITSPDRGEYACFGNDPGDFITLHLGHDLELPTLQGKETWFGIQGVAYWWRGTGPAQATRYEESWRVEELGGERGSARHP